MPQQPQAISRVGAFTSFAGDLRSVIVGDMVGDDYFEHIPRHAAHHAMRRIVSETREDLDNLAATYSAHGVEVHRPKITHDRPGIAQACGTRIMNPMPNFQPHDHVFCLDNKFMNMFLHANRYHDQQSIQHVVDLLRPPVEYIHVQAPRHGITSTTMVCMSQTGPTHQAIATP